MRLFARTGPRSLDSHATAHAATEVRPMPRRHRRVRDDHGTDQGCRQRLRSPSATMKINEVESSGGDPGDWVELVNTGSARPSTCPAGSQGQRRHPRLHRPGGHHRGPGAYLALDVDPAFGLGGAESAAACSCRRHHPRRHYAAGPPTPRRPTADAPTAPAPSRPPHTDQGRGQRVPRSGSASPWPGGRRWPPPTTPTRSAPT